MIEIALELLLSVLAVGNVAVDDDQLLHFSMGIANRAGGGFKDAPPAVFVADAVLDFLPDAGAASLARSFENAEAIVGMNLFESRGSAEFFRRIAKNFLVSGTVVQAVAFHVDQRNHVSGVFGDDAKQLLAVFEAGAITQQPPLLVNKQHGEQRKKITHPELHVNGRAREALPHKAYRPGRALNAWKPASFFAL